MSPSRAVQPLQPAWRRSASRASRFTAPFAAKAVQRRLDRGLARRRDHGGSFMADAFRKRMRFRGVAPSHACVAGPGRNGCRERLFRTLKGQVMHGRIVRTSDDVHEAVRAFVARCNVEWPIGKNGHRSPAAGAPRKPARGPESRGRYGAISAPA